MKKDTYTEDFLKRLKENLNLKKQREVFEAILGKVVWEVLPVDVTANAITKIASFDMCFLDAKNSDIRCSKLISDIAKAAKEKGLQRFQCGAGNGFCMPLKQGNQLYGFIVLCGFTKEITAELMAIFVAFTETVMREVQKEMELTKLYDTIRPRAIALSTIHTVHRLISSTMETDELLPKIARLCLQIMRAQICYIYMYSKEHKKLFIKSAIKIDKEIKNRKASVKMTGLLGRVFKTGTTIMKKKQLLVPLIDEDVMGVISVTNKFGGKPFTEFDKEILITFAEQAVIAIRNTQLYEEQEKVTIGSIKSLATILDTRAPNIYTHSMTFVKLVVEIAKQLGMPQYDIRSLRYAALLHDAGKIMIPDEILKKPRKLTGEEYKIVKEHPEKGVEIVKPIEVLKPVTPIILYHHERYDGTGYPKGLKGENIPLGSRIMAVVDAFVSMISKQPYREKISVQEAVKEIKRYSGTQFDPKVVDAFVNVIGKIDLSTLIKLK